jgi:hypothetical protein
MRVQVDEVSLPMGSLARKRGYADSYGTLTGRGARVPSMPRPTASPMPTPARNVVLMAAGDIRSVVDAAVPELAAADPELFGDMVIDSRLSRVLEAVPGAPLELDGLSQLAQAASKCVPEARVRVVFVAEPLAHGRTSHWDTDHQTAIASLAELDGPLAAAPQAFVASEIVFHALHLLGPGYQPDKLGHGQARNCLYDWVRTSASVESMIDGDGLCPDCLRRLKAHRISPDRLLRLHAAIKELAAGSPVVH